MLDIVVIGAGPIGSRAAYQLANMGYQVAVLEKRAAIGEKSCCTGVISQECVTAFAISPEVIFKQVNSAKVFSPSGVSIRVYRPEVKACIVDRQAFDCELAGKAQLKGAEYYLDSRVENISFNPDRVVLDVAKKEKIGKIEAQAVILATGFNSPLVKKLGFRQAGYFVSGAQAKVELNGVDEVEVYFDQKLAPGFFAWVVPITGGKGLAGLLTRQSPGRHLRDWIKQLEEQGKIIPDKHRIHYGVIPLKPLERTFGERLLLVGDAAGQVKPTTGGGIYFGLLCADIAANTLHNAFLSGELSSKTLSSYERNWRKKLDHELRLEYFARRLYEHLSDSQIDNLFSKFKSTGFIDSLLREDKLSFDWHGGLILKGLKLGAISQANRLLKLPLSLARR